MGKTFKDMNKKLRKPNYSPDKHEKTPFIDSVRDLAYDGRFGSKTN